MSSRGREDTVAVHPEDDMWRQAPLALDCDISA